MDGLKKGLRYFLRIGILGNGVRGLGRRFRGELMAAMAERN